MDYKRYRILYSPRVIDSLDKIYQYIAEEIGSVEAARRKVANIRKDINRLEIFPQAGFDADEKFGKKLDPRYQTRGWTLSKDYIVLYTIVEDTVRLAYLLPSKSDYMKLFKIKSRYD
ncbi:TPA: type II toxin-antitoxin system RelE/ParE family toxin [Streptococcus pneumoniae]|uniref:type II toxin-antitoxin system RelE/ParE family toxin n=1 Tax=Streptococcus pseudopneumoniae TaxID=257758 RepID=UPI00110C21C3|nr:type II toxin-antitoxin system RelE/ParE family toxin [Streptococcus pseudopneumoniae]TMR86130.1 type II toxin-antitoxin system RelE/ParE family toxin [Streptococcus pseudopneumoniae]HEW4830042.1 type II toxin-antitoxin system RelE/ParE family toxin [Streptococcus pneumoniae]